MGTQSTRREFLKKSAVVGLGSGITPASLFPFSTNNIPASQNYGVPVVKKGGKQIFVDDVMISQIHEVKRIVHQADKLEQPVLEADMPWEQGDLYDGKRDRRIYIYGTVLKERGIFRMWYNRLKNNYYATSEDGLNWSRPTLNQLGENNKIQLFNFHSPSIIFDKFETDPTKRYKAIGNVKSTVSQEEIERLKEKFKSYSWYEKSSAYWPAYSTDGLNWKLYPHPAFLTGDTITLAQDPRTGEYLAFHKSSKDPRVKGRQVFLSTSKNMEDWSEPEPVMMADETDHQEARQLEGGTHSEIYNMSAFSYAGQWLGLITLFRRTGSPKVKGPKQSGDDGPIDIRLIHSRDSKNWSRCSDRSPVIALGPYRYDAGSILGICNTPVIVGDEMWMYYTAMTTTHGGYLPEKQMSIARASWRLDGMVSLKAEEKEGMVETSSFIPDGDKLEINADVSNGWLVVEVLNPRGEIVKGFSKEDCEIIRGNKINHLIKWKNKENIPTGKPICIRFYFSKGNLYSYTIT